MLRRRPSARKFVLLLLLSMAAFVAAGCLSGVAGLSEVEALLVMSAVGLVALPPLLLVVPHLTRRKDQ